MRKSVLEGAAHRHRVSSSSESRAARDASNTAPKTQVRPDESFDEGGKIDSCCVRALLAETSTRGRAAGAGRLGADLDYVRRLPRYEP